LSLKQVSEQERNAWLAQQSEDQTAQTDSMADSALGSLEVATPLEGESERTLPVEPEQLGEDVLREESVSVAVGQPVDEGLWVSLIEHEEAGKV